MAEDKGSDKRYDITVTLDIRCVEKDGKPVQKNNQGFFRSSMVWDSAKYPAVVAVELLLAKASDGMIQMGMGQMAEMGFKKELAQFQEAFGQK